MRSSAYQRGAYAYHGSLRSRVAAAALSLALIALIVVMLVRMGVMTGPGQGAISRLVAVTIAPVGKQARARVKAGKVTPDEARVAVVKPEAPVPEPSETPPPLNLIKLTSAEFAAADISRMARSSGSAAPAVAGADGSAAADGGQAPGGGRLHNAQWYREPTDAELAGYFPPGSGAPGQWAVIACRTIDRFGVEDCREMDESPRGSGLARALRQAAWQFKVRPPRIGGKAMIGEWVRIHFDFGRKKQAG
ncbi:MAG: hypothetical protein V4579_02065 [Pseudomonadota bacterium]